jgi:hypothetical protein
MKMSIKLQQMFALVFAVVVVEGAVVGTLAWAVASFEILAGAG